ncbi:prolyl-tRNA editing protein [Lentilactobacillus hilgardii]|uniref:Prolyl-tRNA editing protein n=2 Tax=Lentilactobacillus hilgardii TaxID=1588 RepID=A0A6P1E9C6_LENHI|nr:YbaK/EbsC family protein [Lentilactobacillus hilgardii]EEI71874.1 YbaK/proline--tRNA ligase associated domain protein [Lentilactobacillus hilgardii ATCC 27305]MCT3392361.1 prolyl-tRNA editing protein [Lentilactobacillus hilgardii]QHB51333.1 prolyl-tRNA editing protein [Lentilactobacillus hilgardii]RRG07360.1 MAG: prolyl-tRNA editing protein [Lactobacillus sp.]
MKMATEQEAINLLTDLKINYQRVDHPAIWTMDDPNAPKGLPEVKNLLLKKKKSDQFYLYLTDNTKVDFKSLADQFGLAHSRLTFASEDELENLLGVVSGMVTPLALMHDTKHEVQVLLNSRLKKLPLISAHPNTNTATILLTWTDLLKVLDEMDHHPIMVD